MRSRPLSSVRREQARLSASIQIQPSTGQIIIYVVEPGGRVKIKQLYIDRRTNLLTVACFSLST